MRILVVSQWFPPEAGGGPARFLETSRVWQERGHEVLVLAGLPNWPTGRIHDGYRRRPVVRETYGGVPVLRVPLIPARNEGAARRLVNHGSFVLTASVLGLAERWRPDVVVATSPPLFAPLAGLLLARAAKAPMVLDVRDLWPDSIYALSHLRGSVVRAGLERLERFLYRSAAAVAAVTSGLSEVIRTRGARTVATIPNGVDLDAFAPRPAEPAARELLGGDGGFVVMYAGTLGLAHGLDLAVEAAERLSDEGVRFVFAGDGADRPRLERMTERKRLRNVSFVPVQPREQMPALYAAADVCLVSLRPEPLFASALPSKIFEIMGCARPMIAAVEGEAADVIGRAGAGVVTAPGSVEGLVNAVRACVRNDDLGLMGKAGRKFAEEHFDRRQLAVQYERLMNQARAAYSEDPAD